MSNKYPCIYYDNGKCQKFSDNQYNAWCDFDNCESRTPSNVDHIRAMSDEEIAEWLTDFVELVLEANGLCDKYTISKDFAANVLKSLKQPYNK